jgi:hypothetical protein
LDLRITLGIRLKNLPTPRLRPIDEAALDRAGLGGRQLRCAIADPDLVTRWCELRGQALGRTTGRTIAGAPHQEGNEEGHALPSLLTSCHEALRSDHVTLSATCQNSLADLGRSLRLLNAEVGWFPSLPISSSVSRPENLEPPVITSVQELLRTTQHDE